MNNSVILETKMLITKKPVSPRTIFLQGILNKNNNKHPV